MEFLPDRVVLDVNGARQSLPNDFVGIFAGGEPPTTFLKKIGIGFGQRDLTVEGVREARESREANRASDTLLAAR